jgi:hypothetical protein
LDDGFSAIIEDFEGPIFQVGLNLGVSETTTDETLCIEDGVVGVLCDLFLGRFADETFRIGKSNVGWRSPVTFVVGNDFNSIVMPDSNARSLCSEMDSETNL